MEAKCSSFNSTTSQPMRWSNYTGFQYWEMTPNREGEIGKPPWTLERTGSSVALVISQLIALTFSPKCRSPLLLWPRNSMCEYMCMYMHACTHWCYMWMCIYTCRNTLWCVCVVLLWCNDDVVMYWWHQRFTRWLFMCLFFYCRVGIGCIYGFTIIDYLKNTTVHVHKAVRSGAAGAAWAAPLLLERLPLNHHCCTGAW